MILLGYNNHHLCTENFSERRLKITSPYFILHPKTLSKGYPRTKSILHAVKQERKEEEGEKTDLEVILPILTTWVELWYSLSGSLIVSGVGGIGVR